MILRQEQSIRGQSVTSTHSTRDETLTGALQYAERGWPVFPCHGIVHGRCTCGRPNCDDAGKHPRTLHGWHDASVSPPVIGSWWGRWRHANIGISCGPAGLVVVDVDADRGGGASWGRLMLDYGLELLETLTHRTGGDGWHRIYSVPAGVVVPSGTDRLGPGLDVRAAGGYIIAPPSVHLSGRRYSIDPEYDIDPAPLPAVLVELLTRPRHTAASSGDGPIAAGRRNDKLTRIAGAMRRHGCGTEGITAALLVENERRCQPPLPPGEVERIARSVGRYTPSESLPPRQPRTRWVGRNA